MTYWFRLWPEQIKIAFWILSHVIISVLIGCWEFSKLFNTNNNTGIVIVFSSACISTVRWVVGAYNESCPNTSIPFFAYVPIFPFSPVHYRQKSTRYALVCHICLQFMPFRTTVYRCDLRVNCFIHSSSIISIVCPDNETVWLISTEIHKKNNNN